MAIIQSDMILRRYYVRKIGIINSLKKRDKLSTNIKNNISAAMLAQQWRIDPVKLKEDFERIYRIFQLDSSNTNFLEMIVV